MKEKRSTSDIRRDLDTIRQSMKDDLEILFGPSRKWSGPPEAETHEAPWLAPDYRAVAVVLGIVVGILFIRKPLGVFRLAGRLAGLAAPIVIPVLAKRLRNPDRDFVGGWSPPTRWS